MKINAKILNYSILLFAIFFPLTILLYIFQDIKFIDYIYSLAMNILACIIFAIVTGLITYKRSVITKRDDILFQLYDLIEKVGSIKYLCRKAPYSKEEIKNWGKILIKDWENMTVESRNKELKSLHEHYEMIRKKEVLEVIESYNKIVNFNINYYLRIIEDISFLFYERKKQKRIINSLVDIYNSLIHIKNEENELNKNFELNSINIEIKTELLDKIENKLFTTYSCTEDNIIEERKKVEEKMYPFGEHIDSISNKVFFYHNSILDKIDFAIKITKKEFK